jgi:hypothetical protein
MSGMRMVISAAAGLVFLATSLSSQGAASPPASFEQAADLFVRDGAGLAPIEADELKLDAALDAARSAMRDEARLRRAALHGVAGQDQRFLGEADAAKGAVAFQQGEIDRLAQDIARRSSGMTSDLAQIDALRKQECEPGSAEPACGTPSLGARYDSARTHALAALDQAARHAALAQREMSTIVTAAPAGLSVRSSVSASRP